MDIGNLAKALGLQAQMYVLVSEGAAMQAANWDRVLKREASAYSPADFFEISRQIGDVADELRHIADDNVRAGLRRVSVAGAASKEAFFHQFANSHTEDGYGYCAAVVEFDDGTVATYHASMIQFIDGAAQ